MPDPDTQPHDDPVDEQPRHAAPVDEAPRDEAPVAGAPRGAARRRPRSHLPSAISRPGRPWLGAATLAAAAAVGALVGFGLGDGASLARLGVVTLRLRGLPEFVTPDRGATAAALLGGLHVALVSGVWGAGAGAFGGWLHQRGVRPAARGVVVAVLVLLLALVDGVLPRPVRLAAGALGGAERVLVALLIAAAAWAASRTADLPT